MTYFSQNTRKNVETPPRYNLRHRKSYNREILNKSFSSNLGILENKYHMTNKEFETLVDNVDKIVDHVIEVRKIERRDANSKSTLTRIVYCEYTKFVTRIIEKDVNYENPNYRKHNSLIRPLSEFSSKKTFKHYQYLFKKYEDKKK